MSDFVVQIGGDFSELLRGLQQLESRAKQSGQAVGQGLAEGIQGFSNRSIAALQAELAKLQSRQTRVAVDSRDFDATGRQIQAVQRQLDQLQQRRLALQVDPRSIDGLNLKLQELQKELNSVAVGSEKFKQLQAAIQATERELSRAGQSAEGFTLIDAAVQGLAFSLTNTVTNAIGSAVQAIGGLVSGFAELDTQIRQASAAAGEPGGYDKIARAIDQVGIEAAGTQQQVAELATELIRGGMTVDQMNDSLGAIVRGAEATGTGFAQMGSVVSASLKGFGLQASDATRVVDALVTGANASAASVDGMGMAFKYAAPVARILGVSVEELGIAVGLLTNAGIDASEAGVTLRNGLSKLASAAPQTGGEMTKLTGQAKMAADTMKTLGINIYNADGTLQPMETTLLKLKGAFEKLDPASKIRLAANLFGGEDDGTKWLALLNQSEAEIKKMSATMANTKGATDTARDAMQGFQMEMNQLTGTLDSLGKTLGGVAAAALGPLVKLANQVVGAIAGLPTPVKAATSALIILAGAATASTAAIVLFQRAMTVTAVQTAAAEIKGLAVVMTTTLATAIKGTAAAIPGLLMQLSLIGNLSVGTVISGIASALKTTLVNGFAAASEAVVKFITYLKSADFAAFIAGARSAVVALAPLALALAAVTAAVVSWQYVLSGSKEGADAFTDAQAKADEAVSKLGKSIEKTAEAAKQGRAPILGLFQDAKEQMAQLAAAQGLTALQESFTKIQEPALAFVNTLRTGTAVTAEQAAQAVKFADSLKLIAESAKGTAASLRAKAEAADRAGDPKLAEQYRLAAQTLDSEARASSGLAAALTIQADRAKAAGAATAGQTALTQEQIKALEARREAERQLNEVLAQAPVQQAEAQLAIGTQLVGLAKAAGDAEQSRFGVVRAGLEFQLAKLQELGVGEDVLKAKRMEIEQLDRAALTARYQALTQQQALEVAMLRINQEKAILEANFGALQQRGKLLEAEYELKKAIAGGDADAIAKAQAGVQIQTELLNIQNEKVGLLQQTQPIEAAILNLTQQTAINGERSKAAQMGCKIAADGSLVAVNALAGLTQRVGIITGANAQEQERYRRIAEGSGLALGRAANGAVVLGRTQTDVTRGVQALNQELERARAGYGQTAKGAEATANYANRIRGSLAGAAGPADVLGGAFTSSGKSAPQVAQASRDFAGWLSGAAGYGSKIAGLNLDRRFASVATSTGLAADAAKSFYTWLEQASRLPQGLWTGGPAEAGEQYRINELGQEAFLSAGRLSLIDRPANSLWRAPSKGVVIPAGITARLQATGVLPDSAASSVPFRGAGAGTAELAVEVGKLRQEVAELARKDWGVHVQMRTGPTASQVMNQLHRLR